MRNKKLHQERKIRVLSHYGGGEVSCVKCRFDDDRALSIDHIKAGGADKKKNDLYKWLINNKFPPGYQTLCMNCQFIKRFENNENTLSPLMRRKRQENKLRRYQAEAKIGLKTTASGVIKGYIDKSLELRFNILTVKRYFHIEKGSKEMAILYSTLSRMVKSRELRRLARGFYEKNLDKC